MGQIGHSSPQQWSEEFTAAYMGSPPPTRWSIQRANGKYKDHLVGQLTTISLSSSYITMHSRTIPKLFLLCLTVLNSPSSARITLVAFSSIPLFVPNCIKEVPQAYASHCSTASASPCLPTSLCTAMHASHCPHRPLNLSPIPCADCRTQFTMQKKVGQQLWVAAVVTA